MTGGRPGGARGAGRGGALGAGAEPVGLRAAFPWQRRRHAQPSAESGQASQTIPMGGERLCPCPATVTVGPSILLTVVCIAARALLPML